MKRIAILVVILLVSVGSIFAEGQTEMPTSDQTIRLGIFIPGRLGDSPPYDGLAGAAERLALREEKLELVNVFEAGFDQSKWIEQLLSFAASGKYDVIYTSNEVMGGLAHQVAEQVPNVKFIVNDAYVKGHDRVFTVFINKYQQSYFYGYMMGLISLSEMDGANPDKKIGLVFGQHYTMMDDLIIPGMEAGAKAVDPGFEVKTAMLGNWYDAKKAEALAGNLIDTGVDVLGAICGSGNPGVIRAAVNAGAYIVYYDVAAFDKAPGTVVGSVSAHNDELSMDILEQLVAGEIPWGEPRVVGVEHGYISAPIRAGAYVRSIPENTRALFEEEYNKVLTGSKNLPVPQAVLDKIHNASVGN